MFLPGEPPWTEEHGGLQFMGSRRVGYDRVTEHSTAHIDTYFFTLAVFFSHKDSVFAF